MREGTMVGWPRGNGHGIAEVIERFTDDVTRTLPVRGVTRRAGEAEPAFLIHQEDGGTVPTSVTEIARA